MKKSILMAGLGLSLALAACSGGSEDAGEMREDTAEVATDTAEPMAEATTEATPAADAATNAPAEEAATAGTLAAAREVPTGTYTNSCTDVKLDGVTLSGSCKDRGGVAKDSTLDLTDCPIGHNVMNDNGTLVCREG